ncbi:hypothetical protein MMPV_000253 [Pyropia vietnamensis]
MAVLPNCPPPAPHRPLERPDPVLVAALVAGDGDTVAARLAGDELVNAAALRPYIYFDGTKPYTRNVITVNEHYALIAMCWSPGRASPVHDHAGSGCWLRVVSGELFEALYSVPEGEETDGPCTGVDKVFADKLLSSSDEDGETDTCAGTTPVSDADSSGGDADDGDGDQRVRLVSRRSLPAGSCSYMADDIGIHAVSNCSSVTPAVSLHCYAPPFASCHVFGRVLNGKGVAGAIERVGKEVVMTFDSVGGVVLGEPGGALIKSFVPEGRGDVLMYDI